MKAKTELCLYRVLVTEFWRLSYEVPAENHGAALVMFECMRQTNCLPEPKRRLLGTIEPPEEVQDAGGKTVYYNAPPGDDAERMLFLEMRRRMLIAEMEVSTAIYCSVKFICEIKSWNVDEMLEAIRRSR